MIYRILIVDDESVDLEWMEHRIRNSGKRLEVAAAVTSAPAALNVVRREPIDIILSDIQMPIMSGIELVREVKEIDDHIRVMFVSGYKEFEYAKQAVSFNAFGYLLKPVDNRELYDLLDTVIRSLDTERERKEETLQLKETFSLVKQELLFRWLENGDSQLAMQVVSSLDHDVQAHGAAAAIIEVDRIDWRKANENDEEWHSLYPQVIGFIT